MTLQSAVHPSVTSEPSARCSELSIKPGSAYGPPVPAVDRAEHSDAEAARRTLCVSFVDVAGFSAMMHADEAGTFIADAAGRDHPFFLYVAFTAPHTPWLPTEEFVGKSGAGMYGDFMMLVDSVVGRVLTSLEAAGMDKDTLVLFSSDNGPVWYEKDVQRFGHRSTGRLRGAKGSVWEGGNRVPFIARWPAKVKPGGRSDQLVSFADLFATLAEVAGETPAGGDLPGDSVSFLPALLAPDQEHAPRPPLLHGGKVLRDGDWKLIATKGGRGFGADKSVKYGIALYNLREDPSEKNNLASSEPERVEAMRASIQEILGEESGRR